MEHLTFKGTSAYPTTRAISEAIEGVGGSFNAATDRESTVYWVRVPRREVERAMDVVGELIVRPQLTDRHRERANGHRRGDPLVPRRPVRVLPDPVPDRPCSATVPLGREICGEEAAFEPARRRIREFWAHAYRPANLVVAVVGDLDHDEASVLVATAFGHRQRRVPASPVARPAGRPRVMVGKRSTSQAQLCLGVPALHATIPTAGRSPCSTRSSARDQQPAFPAVREELGLAYDVSSGLVEYADAGALEISAGVDPAGLAAIEAILGSSSGCATSRSPVPSWRSAKRYLSGGLELRLEDTRHARTWLRGQEALHDRVLTLEEALAAIQAVDSAGDPAARRPSSSGTISFGWRPSPRRATCAASRHGCACRGDHPGRPDGRAGPPSPPGVGTGATVAFVVLSARLHLRLGSLALARAELEILAGEGGLDGLGQVDLAEARWRSGDLAAAGQAATAAIEVGEDGAMVLAIAAEAAAALGRPNEARRLATRALEHVGGPVDDLFAGMPLIGVWPSDADEPPPTAGTLFHHEPPSTISLRAGDTDPGVIAARASAGNGRTAAAAAETALPGAAGSPGAPGAPAGPGFWMRMPATGRRRVICPIRPSSWMPGARRSWPDRSTRPSFEWVSRFGSRRPSRRRSSRRPTASRGRRSMSFAATPTGRSGSRRKRSVRTPPQRGPGRVTAGTGPSRRPTPDPPAHPIQSRIRPAHAPKVDMPGIQRTLVLIKPDGVQLTGRPHPRPV